MCWFYIYFFHVCPLDKRVGSKVKRRKKYPKPSWQALTLLVNVGVPKNAPITIVIMMIILMIIIIVIILTMMIK